MVEKKLGETLVDGSYFTFPNTWETFQFDEWSKYKRITPTGVKGCDVVGVDEDDTLWLIEMKDYTYPGATQPQDLPEVVAAKAFGTMGVLFSASHLTSEHGYTEVVRRCVDAKRVHVALHIQVKDAHKSRESILSVLAPLKSKILKYTKSLGVANVIVTDHQYSGSKVPWTARRAPETRTDHIS